MIPAVTLGRSGLSVSRLALGTMTFGREGWGTDEHTSRAILDHYLAAGGNFLDTADVYSNGASETIIGAHLAAGGMRDRVVIATKYTLGSVPGEAEAGGNGRRNLVRSLEGSLRRLRTDRVDLLMVHAWDGSTPVEEVMRSLDDLVSAGKVRYIGLSNVPAWYASRACTLAEWRGWEPLCVLQLEYSLIERGLEYEYPTMCASLGMHLMPWSPLAGGLLREFDGDVAELVAQRGRRNGNSAASRQNHTGREGAIVTEANRIAQALGRSVAQVAINWLAQRPMVGPVLLGASNVSQLADSLGALGFEMPTEMRAALDAVSSPPQAEPYAYLPWVAAGMRANSWGTPPQHTPA